MVKKWFVVAALIVLAILIGVASTALAQDITPRRAYNGPVERGNWSGRAYFGSANEQYEADLAFTVAEDGQIRGRLVLVFRYANMPPELVTLMAQHGCAATFDRIAPDSLPVSGYFTSASEAVGQFNAARCFLEGFGDLTFVRPISGVWYARTSAAGDVFSVQPTTQAGVQSGVQPTVAPGATQAAAASTPTLPAVTPTVVAAAPTATASTAGVATGDAALIELGLKVYGTHCSECHGLTGEGKPPDVADLTDKRVKRMSDEDVLTIINLGVENTEMAGFRTELTKEEITAVMYIIRHPELLRN